MARIARVVVAGSRYPTTKAIGQRETKISMVSPDCGALIGPTSTQGTLTNPNPGGEVKGPFGDSGEATAEIGYEIGSSSTNSPTVSVTAN